jgi:DNA-binding transcriptional MerR regulator
MPACNPSYLMIGETEYVTTVEAANRLGADVTPDMIREWTKRGLLKPAGRYGGRSNIYRLVDVALVERNTRVERRGRTRRAGHLQKIAPVGHNLPTDPQVDAAQIQDIEQTCGLIRADGRPCSKTSLPDPPFRICRAHLREAYLFWKQYLPEVCGFTLADLRQRLGEPAPTPPKVGNPCVYYIRFGDRIKIGHSVDVLARLANLPHDELLAVEPGPIDLERLRHRQFGPHRIKGEWFHPHPDLLSHIDMLINHYGTSQAQLATHLH